MRRLLVFPCLTAASLSETAEAWGGNGGFAPVDPVSPNAERIEDVYYLISAFAVLVFLVVAVPLAIFVVRFRSRGRARTVEGPQIRGNTRLELAWTIAPVLILFVIAGFIFYKLPGITSLSSAAGATELEIQVEGRQFYWQYTYPNGVIAIDRLRVPMGRVVRLEITAPEWDVNHSFWIPAVGGKFDAIPGEMTSFEFKAEKEGVYAGQCAEFCGIQHAVMTASIEVLSAREFDGWIASEARGQDSGSSDLGEATFAGACAKCHGLRGEGLIGPALTGNPILEQQSALADVVRNGVGEMPPVGRDWSDRQLDALTRYLRQNLGAGGGG